MQRHTKKAKDLIITLGLSIVDHMIDLATKIKVEKHILEILKTNWDATIAIILKNHQVYLHHLGIHLK